MADINEDTAMLRSYDQLTIAKGDEPVALRLLSALVMGWDDVQPANQGRLIRDACMIDGDGADLSEPKDVLAFINRQKNRPV